MIDQQALLNAICDKIVRHGNSLYGQLAEIPKSYGKPKSTEDLGIPSVAKEVLGTYSTILDLKEKVLQWTKKNISDTEVINTYQNLTIRINW